jgi:hypothetical protein
MVLLIIVKLVWKFQLLKVTRNRWGAIVAAGMCDFSTQIGTKTEAEIGFVARATVVRRPKTRMKAKYGDFQHGNRHIRIKIQPWEINEICVPIK